MRPELSDDECNAYVAGFIDGEGCIRVTNDSSLLVTVSNTYLPILLNLKDRYGGSVGLQKGAHGNCRPAYHWDICGDRAADFLWTIGPYLIEKRDQAYLALEFHNIPRPRTKSERGAKIIQQLKKLKRPIYDIDTGKHHYAPHVQPTNERGGDTVRDVGRDDLPRDLTPEVAVGTSAEQTTQQQSGDRA